MSQFVVEVNDANGRRGMLDFGGIHIMTPAYVPSDEACHMVGEIPDDARFRSSGACECDLWFQRSDIERFRLHPEEKEMMEAAACGRMDGMQSPARLLHFNVFSDVQVLQKESLIDLLSLQCRANASVIEIPRVFCDTPAYERAVQCALKWHQNAGCETPLMGIARTASDLLMLEQYLPQLGGIGIDCRRFDKQLLYQVRKRLKQQNVWVHAFSAPLRYSEIMNPGNLRKFINWFGVDTVSSFTMSDRVMQYFPAPFPVTGNRNG
ncbi:hypothetical protein L0665_06315 [Methanogenium marinum]|uniref:Uncharacterized protein n=1 Tax=Methanogenium marinum TaxID=348610 RepID=A0A9Q4KSZ3_9EURY|nr:hypothetical protein [Methanogenium marinum]MDE4908222.1 hypothetical protein [Methanogenium marinum]